MPTETYKWRLSTNGSLVGQDDWLLNPADEDYDYQIFEFPLNMSYEEVEQTLWDQGHTYII